MKFHFCLLALVNLFAPTFARLKYLDLIPNSKNVKGVRAIGHTNGQGGGPQTPFGMDFKANGYVWDKKLCEMDSDKDGLTNGQELGDPKCVWKSTADDSKLETTNITHPGVANFGSGSGSGDSATTPIKGSGSGVSSTTNKPITTETPKDNEKSSAILPFASAFALASSIFALAFVY